VDAHSFTAGADYGIHAATMTGFSGGSSATLRDVIASDGATVGEVDGDDEAIRGPSDIAGPMLATAGTYYSKAPQFNTGSLPATIRPYDFYLRVLSGSPIPEMEPTHGVAPPAPRSNGWRGRVIGPATTKSDIFVITVNADHMIGVIVVVDLERGVPEWKVIGGSGMFTGSFIITL
jgi:hypothetical protein